MKITIQPSHSFRSTIIADVPNLSAVVAYSVRAMDEGVPGFSTSGTQLDERRIADAVIREMPHFATPVAFDGYIWGFKVPPRRFAARRFDDWARRPIAVLSVAPRIERGEDTWK